MSELINNSKDRKALLKHMILQLHEGVAPQEVRKRMAELMSKIPYGEVVEVDVEAIRRCLRQSVTPVISPIGLGMDDGHAYNINADVAAAKLAMAAWPLHRGSARSWIDRGG